MKAGLFVNQGNLGDFNGWEPRAAWDRALAVARLAERLGFAALWVPDHVANLPGHEAAGAAAAADGGGDFTLDPFTLLAALAIETRTPSLGHLVTCSPFRNPALVAKAISTIDVASGGRAVCAVGAGWNRREFDAYGIPYGSTGERLAILRDHLEILTRMFAPGTATFDGEHARVVEAPNEPKGFGATPGGGGEIRSGHEVRSGEDVPGGDPSRRIPILVGGNGPEVTWRLAARFADELNLDYLTADQVAKALPVIRARCEEIGRDPETLRVSALANLPDSRAARVEALAHYRSLGLVRLDRIDARIAASDEPLLAYVEELAAAGVGLG